MAWIFNSRIPQCTCLYPAVNRTDNRGKTKNINKNGTFHKILYVSRRRTMPSLLWHMETKKLILLGHFCIFLINVFKCWYWKALGNCRHCNKPTQTMKNTLTSWLKTEFNRERNYVIREIHNNLYRLQSYLTVYWFFIANTSTEIHYPSNSSLRQYWEGGSGSI